MTDTVVSRDFTVAVFVVHHGAVILHPHRKIGKWLPPGGHIEPNELPDAAAIREVLEETGLDIQLVGERGVTFDDPDGPRQLVRPEGIQLEDISEDHQHVDLIYFATLSDPSADVPELLDDMQWVSRDGLDSVDLLPEVRAWAERALVTLG